MRKILAISLTTLFIALGAMPATAFDFALSPGLQINSVLSGTPTLKTGGGEFYPVVNYLKVYGTLDMSNLTLNKEDGPALTVDTTSGMNTIKEPVKYTDKIYLNGAYNGFAVPIPVILQGPMQIGHINFTTAKYNLDRSDRAILQAMANEIAKTGLTGIYLVGTADPVGNTAYNFRLANKRVQAARAYLKNLLVQKGVTNIHIHTQFMGEITAPGANNVANNNDRKVTVLVYPVI